jgi:hypothetical protein
VARAGSSLDALHRTAVFLHPPLAGVRRPPSVEATELTLPTGSLQHAFDFETGAIDGWAIVGGQWAIEDMAGAPSGRKVLVQRATSNEFNVIVAPGGPYTAVDVTVKFKPITGKVDASGGIVFRFSEGTYDVARANALEDNVRLYTYDRSRRQIATTRVTPPTIGQWHGLRVVAVGDQTQVWLDGTLRLEHRDARFKAGRVGLWTKADSITAFDDVVIRGVAGGTS